MDAIRSYIENVFANLPGTDEVMQAKTDMLDNMEEKYHELKNEGFSENEAIGKVISDFGNIDELISELKIEKEIPKNADTKRQISREEVENYIMAKKRSGLLTAIGVFLCVLGVAVMIFLTTASNDVTWLNLNFNRNISPAIGIIPMLIMVAFAVGLFIYSGIRLEKHNFINENFELKGSVKNWVEDQKDKFMPGYTITLIIGVIMCILAPLVIILPIIILDAGNMAVSLAVIMLTLIAVAVFLFTYFGSIKEAYDRLLQLGDYKKEPENKTINAISSGIWPLATIAFFVIGFVFNRWAIAWIVFPITAMLFAAIKAMVKAVKG